MAVNSINGTAGSDYLTGLLKQINEIHGLDDGDTILGGRLADVLTGDAGDDFVWGDAGNDIIDGGAGYDVLFGSKGDDQISGGSDNDFISGGKGNDVINADQGNDVVDGNSGDDVINGGDDADYLFGSSGNDTIDGGAGDDYASGGSGDDVLVASSGGDTYLGGSGFDTLAFNGVNGHVSVDVSKHTALVANDGADYQASLKGIEKIVAGDAGLNALGSKHDEIFVGGAGDDWFRGKGGADVFTGGKGMDTFAWLKKDVIDGKAADIVTDFEVGVDHLELSDFVKGGQAWEKAVRLADTADGVMVQGNAKGVWTDVAVLQGLHVDAVGADQHHMTLADLGMF